MFENAMATINNVTVDYWHSKFQKAEADGVKHNIPAMKESYGAVVVRIRHLLMATKRAQP